MAGVRVLFVDDEEELVSAVVERLGFRGIDAQGALSGADSLRLIKEHRFDVVILDVKMPGLGGLEVIKQMKEEHPDLEVVFLTGHGSEEDAKAGVRMGAFDYLMKPIDIEALVKIIHEAAKLRNNHGRE